MRFITTYFWNPGAGGRRNEDSLSLQKVRWKNREAVMLLVCDGIGGLDAGEWSSGFAAEQMTQWFWEKAVRILERRNWSKVLAYSAIRRFKLLQEEMEWFENSRSLRCGTTCTMAVVCGNRFVLFHCGDSRAYLLGRKEIQLTRDHVKDGKLAKCLGDYGFQKPDVRIGRIRKKEILLLCTDGFCTGAPEGFFKESLREKQAFCEEELDKCVQRVGHFLLACGEQDNLTAIVLRRL